MPELTPDQIRLEQERLDLLQKQTTAAKGLADAYKAIEKSGGRLLADDKEILDLTKSLATASSNIEKSIQKRLSGTATAKDLAKSIRQLEQDQINNQRKYASITQKIDNQKAAALAKTRQLARDEQSIQATLTQELREQDQILDEIDRLKRSGGTAQEIADERQKLQLNKQAIKDLETSLQKTTKQKDLQKELVKSLIETKKAHEGNIEEQEKEIELAKEAKIQAQKAELLEELKKRYRIEEIASLFTIKGLFLLIISQAEKFIAISVAVGKNLGYGADQANRVTTELKNTAQFSSNLNVTLVNAGEAMSQLNTATGGVAEYSADALETQIMLTKQFGLTGDEAAGLYKFSILTGKASSQINDEMVGAFTATRNATKGSANFKETMAAVAKISGQLAANFQNNPAALTKAVVQAQALGTTLEKTKSQGEALLNFESSIEDELKAELLTGQQMNLERARAAALQGDQVTVMKELANQGMTLNKFQNMNVIAQQSYAKALGLTGDELADQLRKQKIAQEQGKSLAEITKEEAIEAEKRQNIQDKFNAAIDKLKDLIGNLVAGPVGKLLEAILKIADIVSMIISPIFGTIGIAIDYMVEGLKVVGTILGVIGAALLVMNARLVAGAILSAIKGAWQALGGIAVVGPVLATAASLAAIGVISKYSKAGDMMSPADGKTQVSTKEGGLFELSPNDDFVAAPGAVEAMKGKGEGGMTTPNIDLTPLINAVNATTAAVNRLYTKDTTVAVDSKDITNRAMQNSTATA
jgi:hypothetical protein